MKVFLATLLLVSGFIPIRTEDIIITEESGIIASPNFPADYPASQDIRWIIFGKAGTNFRLTFETFVTEQDADIVTIYDGPTMTSPVLMSHSGVVLPSTNPIFSSSNAMLIHMITTATNEYSGFLANFDSNGTVSAAKCGGILFGSGTIESRNYPQDYDNNLQCTWRIQSTEEIITLNITNFLTEEKIDLLEVFEGPDINGHLVARLSGSITLPYILRGNGTNMFTVHFTTDDDYALSGFRATFY